MDYTDASQVAADLHRLANDIEDLAEDADTLSDENVNTATANSLIDKQEVVQGDLRQMISNLIQLHAESGEIGGPDRKHDLGRNGSVPIPSNAKTDLPSPSVGKPAETGEAPSWAGQPDDAGAGGQ